MSSKPRFTKKLPDVPMDLVAHLLRDMSRPRCCDGVLLRWELLLLWLLLLLLLELVLRLLLLLLVLLVLVLELLRFRHDDAFVIDMFREVMLVVLVYAVVQAVMVSQR